VSRASRLEKRLRSLATLEAAYEALLLAELRTCAAGTWGLFGQNDEVLERNGLVRYLSSEARELLDLGATIARERASLVLDEYDLHARFMFYRSLPREQLLGEPKLALQLLAEIAQMRNSP
jgi:hypothetical protein